MRIPIGFVNLPCVVRVTQRQRDRLFISRPALTSVGFLQKHTYYFRFILDLHR